MAEKILIALSPERVTLVHWRSNRVLRELTVGNTEDGVAMCREILAFLASVPVYLMVDTVEEDYRTEVLPHARGADRRELLARKLKQHYRNTPYCAAQWQGREPGGRRDDRYQFAALTNAEALAPWMDVIEELALPLAGVYPAPMAGLALVRKLRLRTPNVLLAARTSGGLRLTYFRAGQFRMSRLAPLDAPHSARGEQSYADEIANTRLYLHALQAAALDEPLAVVVLDPRGADAEAYRAIAADSPSLECVHLTSADAARVMKSPAIADAQDAETVFLHLLALRAPEHNLAPAAARRVHRRLRSRASLYRACALAAVAGVCASGYGLWHAHAVDEAMAAAAHERRQFETRYEAVTRSFPDAPASASALEQAVRVAHRLKAEARTPETALVVVSRALTRASEVSLTAMRWRAGSAAPAPGTAPPPSPAAVPEEKVVLNGEIRPFTGDYRAAMAAIRRLADDLARDPAVREVRIARLPLDIDPAVALSGNTRDSTESGRSAEFTLELTLKARS